MDTGYTIHLDMICILYKYFKTQTKKPSYNVEVNKHDVLHSLAIVSPNRKFIFHFPYILISVRIYSTDLINSLGRRP